MHDPLRFLLCAPWLLAPALSTAQSPGTDPIPVASAPQSPVFATQEPDGTVTAGGPDYRLHGSAGGVAFLALPGSSSASPAAVQFTLATVHRGDHVTFAGPATASPIAASPSELRYEHAPTLTERYELREDGAEQSFVFATRPAGHGDLVVRGTIVTDLPLVSASDQGVRYEQDGAGVTFGAVTGIDADGASVRGSIRAGAGFVEWVLPAAFVDAACYPLVLDPLIGNAFSIASTSNTDDVLPSVAYDASSGRYLVVWNVVQTVAEAEVRGQFVSSAGALIGSSFVIEADGDVGVRPLVVGINASNRFLVAFRRHALIVLPSISIDGSWYVRAVTASSGALSGRVLLDAPLAGDPAAPECALAGDLRSIAAGSDQKAIAVLRRNAFLFNGERLLSRAIVVPTSGDPTVEPLRQLLETADQLDGVTITRHGGSAGRWLIAVARNTLSGSTPTTIWGQFVDEDGDDCDAPITIRTGTTGVGKPTAATKDGAHFAVAWQDAATLGIAIRSVVANGACGSIMPVFGAVADPTTAGLDTQPQLEFARNKYVLVWKRSFLTGPVPRVFVRGLDPDGCTACGEEWSVDSTVLGLDTPAIASRASGGDVLNDDALVVWSNTTVRGRRFEAFSTTSVVDLGGACIAGPGNVPGHAGAPRLGDEDFAFTLTAPTAPVVGLVIGLSSNPAPCGPCTLVPNPDVIVFGSGPFALPIPCDTNWLGGQIWAQWILDTPGGCPSLPSYSVSSAQRFTIVE